MQYFLVVLELWKKLTPEQKQAVYSLLMKLYKIVRERLMEENKYTEEEMAALDAILEADPSTIGNFPPPQPPTLPSDPLVPPVIPPNTPPVSYYGKPIFENPLHMSATQLQAYSFGLGDNVWTVENPSIFGRQVWIVQPHDTGLALPGAEYLGVI